MSDEFNKLLLEMARQVIGDRQKPADSKLDLDKDSNIDNVKNIKLNGLNGGGAAILDVNAIARALIVGTESSQRDSMTVSKAFESIRGVNKSNLEALKSATGSAVPQAVIDALKVYFMPPDDSIDASCNDLSTMFTRHVILSAYSLIFKEYSSSPAGFVNESFLAGLLDGSSIPAAGAKTIADMKFDNSNVGISLKTVKSDSKLEGSFSNLMRTLGIMYRVEGESAAYASKIDKVKQEHTGGLFYLLFNKDSDASHRITCFRVNREEIYSAIESYIVNQKGERMSTDEDGTFVFRSKKDYLGLRLKFAGLLGIKFNSIVDDSVIGISDYVTIKQNIELQKPVIADAKDTNTKKIIDTLNLLNKFYSVYYNAVIAFASDPSGKNLKKIKTELVSMSAIDPKNLVINGNCS